MIYIPQIYASIPSLTTVKDGKDETIVAMDTLTCPEMMQQAAQGHWYTTVVLTNTPVMFFPVYVVLNSQTVQQLGHGCFGSIH